MTDLRRGLQALARKAPASWRRLVKRFLPESLLDELYPSLPWPRIAPSPEVKKPKNGQSAYPPAKRRCKTKQLHVAMISGFGKSAAGRLTTIVADCGNSPEDIAQAAWSLASWHRSRSEYEEALGYIMLRRRAAPNLRFEKLQLTLEIDTLLQIGMEREAETVIEAGIAKLGEVPELCLCAANTIALSKDLQPSERDRLRLEWISKPLVAADFVPLELKDLNRPLMLDNITAQAAPHPRDSEAAVSVLMPAYNAEETIRAAIESVLAQSWTNLELIVVDDGSTDATWPAIQAQAAKDDRVVAFKHEQNRGVYVARNTALSMAGGDFVTVHDADDWVHPERLALQITNLIDSRNIVNSTKHVRVSPDLRAIAKPDGKFIRQNCSSLMTAREHVLELGGWDEARMGGDEELYSRIQLKHGTGRNELCGILPLAFGGAGPQSLTAHPRLGAKTNRYGPRREYKEAYRYWHQVESCKVKPNFAIEKGARRFPIPRICSIASPKELVSDILLLSDFSRKEASKDDARSLEACQRLGVQCKCWHWPRISHAGRDIDIEIRKLLHEGVAESVVVGERVLCKLIIVQDPVILKQLPDTPLEVRCEHCVTAVGETPRSRGEGGRVSYELSRILKNAHAAFGVVPVLAPISYLVRRVLKEAPETISLTDIDWLPLVDPPQFRRESSRTNARPPIIGRYCLDHRDNWLSTATEIREAYCTDTEFEVRLLGRAESPTRILGNLPANWTVVPSSETRGFLAGLDFFVHYPHERALNASIREPIEAMAAGRPVILPPRFIEIFGDAALYADPANVYITVRALWSDKRTYEAQIDRGFRFIDNNCSLDCFGNRVSPYLQ